MRSEAQTLSDWMILAGAFLGAGAFLFVAITLGLQVVVLHLGPAGKILRGGLALMFLFLGIFFATVGALYRKSFEEHPRSEFR